MIRFNITPEITTAVRDGILSIFRVRGLRIHNLDTGQDEKWNGSAWEPIAAGGALEASETVAGIIRAATLSEVGGSTDDLAVTPGNLRQFFGIARFASIEEALTFTGDDVTTTFQIAGLIGGGSALAVRSIVQVTNVTTGNVVKDSEVTINKDVNNGNLTLTFAAAPTTDLYSVCIITISGY